jgi:hypothetical protein
LGDGERDWREWATGVVLLVAGCLAFVIRGGQGRGILDRTTCDDQEPHRRKKKGRAAAQLKGKKLQTFTIQELVPHFAFVDIRNERLYMRLLSICHKAKQRRGRN